MLFSHAIADAISAPIGTAKKENRTIKAMIQKGQRKDKKDDEKKDILCVSTLQNEPFLWISMRTGVLATCF